MRIVSRISLLALILVVTGCGYRFGLAERRVPGGYSLVAVPVFRNLSAEPGAEVFFTNAMIREIERSKLASVAPKSSAQVILEGTIEGVTYSSSGTNPDNIPPGAQQNQSYVVSVSTKLILKRMSDQKIIWTGSFSGDSTYQTPRVSITGLNTVNALYNHSARQREIEKLAESMMAEAQDRLTESF